MRKVTFLSQKGGAGKSTTATQFAVYAATQDEVVCLTDIDPQGSAFLWKSFRKANTPIVLKALPEKLPQMVVDAARLGVTLMMIDTPPHTDKAAIEAIRVADLILCPAKPGLFNLGALADTIRLLELTESKSKALAFINDISTLKDQRAVEIAEIQATLEKFDIKVADKKLSHHQAIVDAIAEGRGITETSPRSIASKEVKALWDEINQMWPLAVTTNAEVTA